MKVVELKDLGVATKFLGIVFEYDADTRWVLDQECVIEEILDKFGLSNSISVRVMIGGEDGEGGDVSSALIPSGGSGTPQRTIVQIIQSMVSSLLWISRCTRPDIAFAVHRATRSSHAPSVGDWRLINKIAKYLTGTSHFKFMIRGEPSGMKGEGVLVESLSDANYSADKTNRRLVRGGVLMVGSMIVGWLCKKQK